MNVNISYNIQGGQINKNITTQHKMNQSCFKCGGDDLFYPFAGKKGRQNAIEMKVIDGSYIKCHKMQRRGKTIPISYKQGIASSCNVYLYRKRTSV
jgi:hypothetical protein